MILAGDIGGTNSRLAFFTIENGRLKPEIEHVYPSRDYTGLELVVREFVSEYKPSIRHACFGIAGPVSHGHSHMPNLKWTVESSVLVNELGLRQVTLINDLEANAYGVAALEEKDFAVINRGAPASDGNAAVISAGTGLGEAGLFWDGRTHRPFACEGGHVDFGPADELQDEMLRYLRAQLGHVSWERVLSGPGIFSIYKFLRDSGHGEEPAWLTEELKQGDSSAHVVAHGLDGKSELCVKTLGLFASIYGSEAGNLALKLMATGGVYIGGGIAPRIISKLTQPEFMQSFTDKGRLKPMLEAISVKVILNDKTALLGAGRCAALKGSLL